ncbi:hypothetical protein KCU77_g3627, partial [Aureobasidium melanogenum]
MSNGRVVITIDENNVDNTTENQVQRLVRELNEARTTIAYLRVDLSSLQAENSRLRAQTRVQYPEDGQPFQSSSANPRTHSMRIRGLGPGAVRGNLVTYNINGSQHHEEDEAGSKITICINQNGKLQTDSQVDQQEWYEFEAAWAVQVQQFDQKNKDWPLVDLKGKCLWSTVISKPTTQHWTTEEPGRFACRQCANKLRICAGQVNGTLQLLPLPPLPVSADHEANDLLGNYVVKKDNVSRRAPSVWS